MWSSKETVNIAVNISSKVILMSDSVACLCRMDTKESCEKVIGALNGALLHGGKEPLTIKFADSSNKRKQTQSKSLVINNMSMIICLHHMIRVRPWSLTICL